MQNLISDSGNDSVIVLRTENIFQSAMTVLAWLYQEGQVNFPALPWRGPDDRNMTSTQERQRSAPLLSLPLIIKMQPTEQSQQHNAGLPAANITSVCSTITSYLALCPSLDLILH